MASFVLGLPGVTVSEAQLINLEEPKGSLPASLSLSPIEDNIG